MSNADIIRIWKDVEYRNSLSPEEQAAFPENPAGIIELSDDELIRTSGAGTASDASLGCCPNTDSLTCSVQCSLEITVLSVTTVISM